MQASHFARVGFHVIAANAPGFLHSSNLLGSSGVCLTQACSLGGLAALSSGLKRPGALGPSNSWPGHSSLIDVQPRSAWLRTTPTLKPVLLLWSYARRSTAFARATFYASGLVWLCGFADPLVRVSRAKLPNLPNHCHLSSAILLGETSCSVTFRHNWP